MLILCMMCLMSVSCKSHNVPRIAQIDTDRNESHFLQRVDTVMVRDSVYRHDSVFYRERTIHDTVYVTKEVYRDRLHSTLNSQHSTLADTIHIVEYRERVIEHPPERYVPKFYRWCTGLLWAILVLAIGRLALKRWL